jgi:hypothetical protein
MDVPWNGKMYRNAVPNVQANDALHKAMANWSGTGDTQFMA